MARKDSKLETPDQTVKDAALVVNGVFVRALGSRSGHESIRMLAVRNVNVLNTVGAAVDLLTGGNDLAQGHLLRSSVAKRGRIPGPSANSWSRSASVKS